MYHNEMQLFNIMVAIFFGLVNLGVAISVYALAKEVFSKKRGK